VLNCKITFSAPKNLVFLDTNSLSGRIHFTIEAHSITVNSFVKRLYKNLGLPVDKDVSNYFNKEEEKKGTWKDIKNEAHNKAKYQTKGIPFCAYDFLLS